MRLVVGDCVLVNCRMVAHSCGHKVMVRDIPRQLGSLGIPVVSDGKPVKDKHAVFVRCAGTDFVLVRIVERELYAAQKLTVLVLLDDLDAASGGRIGIGQGNDFPVCIQIELFNAALREVTGRRVCLLTVVRAEGQSCKDHKAVFIRRAFDNLGHVFVV